MGTKKYIVLMIAVMILTACSESGDVEDIIISKEKIENTSSVLQVDVASLGFEALGGSKEFRITSNTGWRITAPDWCVLSATTGSDNAVITVTADENTTAEQRSGSIVVTGVGASPVTIIVNQDEQKNVQTIPGAGDNVPPSV
jgi:flagellar biosynthesis/type III secretory pathway M-ring protein FliF/YscJ